MGGNGETYANSYERLARGVGDGDAGGAQAADKYVVGVSNTLIGNGWREEMICSIKAEAEASGKVSKVVVANRNGGPSEQIADIRNLISAGANIIIINPSDREALNPVIKQAADKGIVVVAVDQAVSAPQAYVLTNDQVEYAKLGAKWLFDKLGGKGAVVEMRGIDGVPADADRHEGFMEVLKSYPDIKVTIGVHRLGARQDRAGDQGPAGLGQADRRRLDLGHRFDGGGRLQDRGQAVRAGGRRRQQRLYRPAHRPEGARASSGAAVSNPPAVGGAGLGLALDILAKKEHPHLIKITPTIWNNDTGMAELKKAYNPKLDPFYSVAVNVPPYTHYTMDQMIACKGP